MVAHLLKAAALAALLLVPAAAAIACTPAVADSNLIAPGKLQLSINPTNPPQQYVDKEGKLQGLNVELAKELSKRLCLKVDLIRMDFPGMIPATKGGRIDGMDTGMFWNEERSKILYMVPYGVQSISVVVAPNSTVKISSEKDLYGKASGVEVSSYQMNWLEKFNDAGTKKGQKSIDIRTFPTATDVVSALRAGQVDDALLVDSVARDLVDRHLARQVLDGLGKNRMSMAFRNKAVADAVVKGLNEMRSDGTYEALFNKFGLTDLPQGTPIAIDGPGPA
jgi:polar amino acid transport system substrate-binding protein